MLTTLSALKSNYLNIDPLDTDRDATITACIEQAGSYIRTLCNQPIEQESLDYYFNGDRVANADLSKQLLGGDGYATKLLPYTTPVTLSGLYHRTLPTDSWVSQSGAVIYKHGDLFRLYSSDGFAWPLYKAELSVGYTSIPGDVVHAASELALYIWNETSVSNEARAGVASKSIAQNGITTTKTFADIVMKLKPILTKYTIYTV